MGLLAPKMKTQPRKGLWGHLSCVEEAGRDTQKERRICWTWTQMMMRELGLGTAASDVSRALEKWGY